LARKGGRNDEEVVAGGVLVLPLFSSLEDMAVGRGRDTCGAGGGSCYCCR
jgi:hypothetical protein